MNNDLRPEVLISEDEILQRVQQFAELISKEYRDKGELVLVGVLKGAFILLADLTRRLTIPHRVEFIAVSSYGRSSTSKGAVRMLMDVREDIKDKNVIIVEDIIDTGHTLHYLISLFENRAPASLRTCVLVRKASGAEVDVEVEYLGFDIPDVWVVGYGLDFAEKNRTLPYIGVVTPDE